MRFTMQTPRRFSVAASAASLLAFAMIATALAEPAQGPSDEPPPPRGEPGEPQPRPRPEGDFRGGPPPRERGQFRPEAAGPRMMQPSPDRFVERAMRYDDDKDGKLDRDELRKFAEDLMDRFPPGQGEPLRERFERGEFPEGGKRPDLSQKPFDGERPERPRRVEDGPRPEPTRRPADDRPVPPPEDAFRE